MRTTLFLAFVVLGAGATTGDAAPPIRGEQIVFASNRGVNAYNSEIYSVRVDGSGRRNLTRNQGSEGNAVLSPDGRRIAFGAVRVESGHRVDGLYVMRTGGQAQRRVTPPDIGVASRGSWSPDGRLLVFSAGQVGRSQVWVVGPSGDGLRLVTAGGLEPAFSPRGRRIAFVTDNNGAGPLAIVNVDGSDRRGLTLGESDYGPVWSPDGRSLLFIRDQGVGRHELYRVSAAGTGLRRLVRTGEDEHVSDPSWSPDGRSIVFVKGSVSKNAVFRVGSDGRGLRRLAIGELPKWSPDGMRIAFIRGGEILVMGASGRPRRVLKEFPSTLTDGPTWSRDGQRLIFASMLQRNDYEISVVGADGRGRRQLTRNSVNDRLPTWSPDRRSIAFVRGAVAVGKEGAIWLMTATGGRTRPLLRGTHPTWSPNGKEIAFSRGERVYVITLRGRKVRLVTAGVKPSWSPVKSEIAFFRGKRLVARDLPSGTERALADFSCPAGQGLTVAGPEWSPDGSRLVVVFHCQEKVIPYSATVFAEVVNADGTGRHELSFDELDFSRFAWSPDGQRGAFSTRRFDQRIATARLDGSERAPVTSGAGRDRDPDW